MSSELWRKLLFLFRRRQLDRDLEEEMRFHLEMKARDAGAAEAQRAFGNATLWREDSREAWGWRTLDALARDLRYALRGLARRPGFAAVAIATLALGLGANTAIFGLLYNVVLRPLPYPDAERLVKVNLTLQSDRRGVRDVAFSYPKYQDLKRLNTVFDRTAAYARRELTWSSPAPADRITGEFVSAEYFPMLGVTAALGRVFVPEEDAAPGARPVAVIGDELWRRRFGADRGVLGKTIRIEQTPLVIVGVAPESFRGDSEHAEIWIPMMMAPVVLNSPGTLTNRVQHWHEVIARLKPDASVQRAAAEVREVMRRIEEAKPIWFGETWGSAVTPLAESKQDRSLARGLVILYVAVGLVLLIACANLANLVMARMMGRQKEVAMRLALGAGRGTVVRQFLMENVILALAGAFAGVLVAQASLRMLERLRPAGTLSNWPSYLRQVDPQSLRLTGPVLVFSLALALATGLIFGLAPALKAAHGDVGEVLKGGSLWRKGRRGVAGGRVLLAAQTALVIVLLGGAGLMLRSFEKLMRQPLGIDARNVLTFRVSLSNPKYRGASGQQFLNRAMARLRDLAGVQAATMGELPVRERGTVTTAPFDDRHEKEYIGLHYVDPGFFELFKVPLRSGRTFQESDRHGPAVAVITTSVAAQVFPGQSPLGHHITQGDKPIEIVGVVEEFRFEKQRQQLTIVGDVFLTPAWGGYAAVRTAANPMRLAPAVRRLVADMDPEIPVFDMKTIEDYVFESNAASRFLTVLLGAFAGLALALAAVGIYGVFSYAVAARTREFGIRLASGAGASDMLRLVVGEGAVVCGTGLAIGLPAAVAAARVFEDLLFEVRSTDLLTYAVACAVLASTAVAACLIPAIRAMRIDPVDALRHE